MLALLVPQARIWDALETACSEVPLRHPPRPGKRDVADLVLMCDSLLADHDEAR